MARHGAIALPLDVQTLLIRAGSVEVADGQKWILSLLEKHGLRVAHMLWRMLGAEADVLDAYQTAVCKLVARGPEGITSNASGYFYRTAMSAGIELLRKRKRARELWPAVVEAEQRREADRGGPASPESAEMVDQLRGAICRLPPSLREVIILRDLAELPYRQVAALAGIQVTTARLYRRQAIVRLAELLGSEGAT